MTGAFAGMWNCPLPFTPGYDLSGVVHAIGKEVTDFIVGDEVFGMSWGHDEPVGNTVASTFAEFIDLPASVLSLKPKAVTHDTAAALPMVGVTALQLLNTVKVGAGTKVLLLGGSSAVGTVLIQLAKLRGAHLTTTASTRAISYVSQFNADRVINYNEESWWLETKPDYDVVIDVVGEPQAFEHAQDENVVKNGGSFVTAVDFSLGFNPVAHAPRFSYAAAFSARSSRADLDYLVGLVNKGELKLPIDEVFPFTQDGVRAIFRKLKGGKSLGKNIVRIVA